MLGEKKKDVRDSKFKEKEYKDWYVGLALGSGQTENFQPLVYLMNFCSDYLEISD